MAIIIELPSSPICSVICTFDARAVPNLICYGVVVVKWMSSIRVYETRWLQTTTSNSVRDVSTVMCRVCMDETGVLLFFEIIKTYAITVSFGIPLMDNFVNDICPAERKKPWNLTSTIDCDLTWDVERLWNSYKQSWPTQQKCIECWTQNKAMSCALWSHNIPSIVRGPISVSSTQFEILRVKSYKACGQRCK